MSTLQADNTSVRAKSKRPAEGAQKTAFRPVLDNPLPVSWPPLSGPVRKLILDALLAFLKQPLAPDELSIADWRLHEHARRRGRVHGAGKGKGKQDTADKGPDANAPPPAKKAKRPPPNPAPSDPSVPTPSHSITLRSDRTIQVPSLVHKPRPPRPPPAAPLAKPQLLNHLSIGINEVTKALESRIRWGRWELGDSSAAPGGATASQPPAPSTSALPVASTSNDSLVRGPTPSPTPSMVAELSKPRRRRHSAHPASVPPPPAAIPSITHARPSFRFLDHSLPRPSTRLPPYLLPPSETSPFFRLLANAHALKLKRQKEADTWLRTTLKGVKKRDVQEGMLHDAITMDRRTVARLEAPRVGKGAGAKGKGKRGDVGVGKGKGKSGALPDQEAVVVSLEESGEEGGAEVQTGEEADDVEWVHMIDVVFVCRPDINPTSLVDHLPTMAAAANGVKEAMDAVLDSLNDDPSMSAPNDMDTDQAPADSTAPSRPVQHTVYLVPLDLGAEQQLGDVLALRRVGAIGLSSLAPGANPLLDLVRQHVKPLVAPWLVPHVSNPVPRPLAGPVRRLVPTHVKHLRTTAPVDMKGANARAKAGRKAAKKRKREEGEEGEDEGVYMAED